jgi:hypothetical protein
VKLAGSEQQIGERRSPLVRLSKALLFKAIRPMIPFTEIKHEIG